MKLNLNPLKMSMPMQVLIGVLFVIFIGEYIPQSCKAFLYSISLTMKEILMFMLPLIIFSCLASSILSLGKRGKDVLIFLAILLLAVFVSNLMAVLGAYIPSLFGAKLVSVSSQIVTGLDRQELGTLWGLELPRFFDVKYVLFVGLIFGIIFTFFKVSAIDKATNALRQFSNFFLVKCFGPLIPLFILGFMARLEHEGMLKLLITSYGPLFFFVIIATLTYVTAMFLIFNNFDVKETLRHLKNSLVPAVTGFSTMSSAVAMPLTLKAAEENTRDPLIARTVIPATVNPHMVGNTFITSILAAAVMTSYGMGLPPFSAYIIFGLYFAITQFAGAGVASGAVTLMMVPHFEDVLGFTPGMCELMIMLNLLFDAPITAGNVMGNIALTSGLSRILRKTGVVKNEISQA